MVPQKQSWTINTCDEERSKKWVVLIDDVSP